MNKRTRNRVVGTIFVLVSMFLSFQSNAFQERSGVSSAPCTGTKINDNILIASVNWGCTTERRCEYIDNMVMNGAPDTMEACCSMSLSETCRRDVKHQQIQFQHDLWQQMQISEQRGLALQKACLNKKTARSLDQMNEINPVDSLFLKGCYLSTRELQDVVNIQVEQPETAEMALLLSHRYDLDIPVRQETWSPVENMIFQWVSESRR